MTDTAKQTRIIESVAYDATLLLSAKNVETETGLTPWQLLEQRNKLIELLEEFMLSDMDHPLFDEAHQLISDIKNGDENE